MRWNRSAEKTGLSDSEKCRVLNAYVYIGGRTLKKCWKEALKGLIIINVDTIETKSSDFRISLLALIESDRECVDKG